MYGDSSAALAIAKRKGAGKLRHINISCLWIQEMQGTKQLELRKVLGTENPADLMMKHLPRLSLDKCMRQLNQHHAQGRAMAGLDVQGAGAGSVNPSPSRGAGVGEAAAARGHKSARPTEGKLEANSSCSKRIPATGQTGIRLHSLRTRIPATGQTGIRLNSLQPCREETAGSPIIFQGGRQGHKRPGVVNNGASEESTCPPMDEVAGWGLL